MSQPMTQCPPDSDLMKAWTGYQETDDFKNTLYWATTRLRMRQERAAEIGLDPAANVVTDEVRQHYAVGSLWASFMAGFAAAGGKVSFP